MDTPRLLITGSRNWTDRRAILDGMTFAAGLFRTPRLIVVHGDCPTGADAIADQWADQMGWNRERHPAKWRTDTGELDRAAGYARNTVMVGLGADICLGFVNPCIRKWCRVKHEHGSHGATDCLKKALNAGILVKKYGWKPEAA